MLANPGSVSYTRSMPLRLTIAFGANPFVRPLQDGTVQPDGIELAWDSQERGSRGSETLFFRNLVDDAFDVSEMGIPWTLRVMERRTGGRWDWAKLPVFLSRGTGWANLWVSTASGIGKLEDLVGKRIAVPEYQMSMCMWLRVMLREFYGIKAEENVSYCVRPKEEHQGRALGEGADEPPTPVQVRWLTAEQSPVDLLERGDLDAAVVGAGSGRANMSPLFPDGGRALIGAFYRKTGAHQLNHHVIVQNRVLREHPWVAGSLYHAFEQAKTVAYERMQQDRPAQFEAEMAGFGGDPYPVGVASMRTSVDRYIDELMASGALRSRVSVDDVYHPSLLDT